MSRKVFSFKIRIDTDDFSDEFSELLQEESFDKAKETIYEAISQALQNAGLNIDHGENIIFLKAEEHFIDLT